MFKDIESLFDGREQAFIEHGYFILSMLVGATIPGFSFESMIEIWKISGSYISKMYESRLKTRQGIG